MASKLASVATAILQTLEETTTSASDITPKGHLYAALMSIVSLDEFNSIMEIMAEAGWIIVTSETVKLTDTGRDLVKSAMVESAQNETN